MSDVDKLRVVRDDLRQRALNVVIAARSFKESLTLIEGDCPVCNGVIGATPTHDADCPLGALMEALP